jgi:hypothetical protein
MLTDVAVGALERALQNGTLILFARALCDAFTCFFDKGFVIIRCINCTIVQAQVPTNE